MSKRQIESDSDIDVSSSDESDNEQQLTEQIDEELINVDFDFFDLNPEIDFHATKNFLRQLFGDDYNEFNLSEITDLILTKNSIGTSIKTDGINSDPFALLSVINLSNNLDKSCIKTLISYLVKKTNNKLEFNILLKKLFTKSNEKKIGLIISERLINMPVEVVPPMYNMLIEEMSKAKDSHEKYEFDYFLIISRVYKLVDAKETVEQDQNSKKKKKIEEKVVEMDYFHLEDEILEKLAKYHQVYDYDNENKQESDSRRVFNDYGIEPKLSLILIDKDNLAKSVLEMSETFPAP
ncbi:unnamed protein product [Candida verbasci]|uniref:Protein BCP1 n=1 Tax=Candida verbasci TaxID=1227364 RepID=A0A9W4XCF8_9ASCO|nr:unnamed protein product [Candida verbasci]